MRDRRFLPSISMLTAFDAVIRRGSVIDAARELNLTQGSVSRLIQGLEAQLGCTLFARTRKRLVPTEAASAYHDRIARALDLVQRAGLGLVANPAGGALSLAVLPTFATRWLAPRLGSFFGANTGVTINLSTRVEPFTFEAEPFDAVIYFGAARADLPRLKLFDERYTACASPAFLRDRGIRSAADLVDQPLLILQTRAERGWRDWFEGQGISAPAISGMVIDQFSMMIQAAVSGFGVALLPAYLAELEIAEHRLVAIGTPAVPGRGSYWLGWPQRTERLAPLVAFRSWLVGEAERG